MLIRTDETLAATVDQDKKLIARDQKMAWLNDQITNCPTVTGDGVNLADPDQQLGVPMSDLLFEMKLSRLASSLIFIQHPNNATKKAIYRPIADGLEYLCAYESGIMPEHSIMRVMVHEYPDPALFTGQRPLERSELQDHVIVDDPGSPLGYKLEWDPKARKAGMLYVEKGFGEAKRGWRTVLVRLVQNNIVGFQAVEKEFGSDNRAEWAKATGKQESAVPIW